MVFAWRWSRSRLLAGYQGCSRGARDHGGPSAGQGKSLGPRVHRSRSAFSTPPAHGQALAPARAEERLDAVERALPDCEVLLHGPSTLSRIVARGEQAHIRA